MKVRLLVAALAACLPAASFAAPLYVPNRDGKWPGAEVPFADSQSIQHDALAAGLDGVPGRPRTIADGVYLIAAPPPAGSVGVIADVATAEAARAAGRRAPAGGVSALARVGGTTADLGDVLGNRSYRDAAVDLLALPHLDVEAIDLDAIILTQDEGGAVASTTSPAVLAAVTALLFAASLILTGVLMRRRRPVAPERGFHPLPLPVKALPPVRRHRRPMRAKPPGDDSGPATTRRPGRSRLGPASR